jgi:hypothetical protein
LRQSAAKMLKVLIDPIAVQARQLGDFSGFHIQTKQPQQEPKFRRRNSRTSKIPVSHCHHWLYSVFAYA